MAIRLIREGSDTPNITNRDDAIMARYAYGDSGIVQNYGSELGYELLQEDSSSSLQIKSGRVVLQGWEVDIDEIGVSVTLPKVRGRMYAVYLEVNLADETASIKSTYQQHVFPEIDPGDDLSQYKQGIARMRLFNVAVAVSGHYSVFKKAPVIPYMSDIQRRLEELGFKEGAAEIISCVYQDGSAVPESRIKINTVRKLGKFVQFFLEIGGYFDAPSDLTKRFKLEFRIPEEFAPKEPQSVDISSYIAGHIPAKVIAYGGYSLEGNDPSMRWHYNFVGMNEFGGGYSYDIYGNVTQSDSIVIDGVSSLYITASWEIN